MSRFFCKLICAIVLSTNLAARAEKVSDDYNVFVAQQMTKQLAAGLRYKDVFGSFKARGPKDQEVLKMILQTYGEQKMPVPKLEGRKLIFSDGSKPLQIELVDYPMGKIRVNSQDVDFRSYVTLADKLSYIERILAHPRAQIWGPHPISLLLRAEPAQAGDWLRPLILSMDSWVGLWNHKESPRTNPEQIKIGKIIQAIQNQFVIEKGMTNLRVDLSRCELNEGAIWAEGNNLVFSWGQYDKTPLSDMMRECCGQKMRKLCEAEVNRVFPASNAKPIPFKEWQSTH